MQHQVPENFLRFPNKLVVARHFKVVLIGTHAHSEIHHAVFWADDLCGKRGFLCGSKCNLAYAPLI